MTEDGVARRDGRACRTDIVFRAVFGMRPKITIVRADIGRTYTLNSPFFGFLSSGERKKKQ